MKFLNSKIETFRHHFFIINRKILRKWNDNDLWVRLNQKTRKWRNKIKIKEDIERFKINQVELATMQLAQNNKHKKQWRTTKNAMKETETQFKIDVKDFRNGI